MANSPHSELTTAAMHTVIRWTHADATARLAESVVASDIGKISHQLLDDTFWVLADAAPTWIQLG